MVLQLPPFEQVMPFKVREKCLQVRRDGLSIRAEFLAQFVGNFVFRAVLHQEFEHAGADEVQPKHPAVEDVENDGADRVSVELDRQAGGRYAGPKQTG